jgi:hypothetical protein
MRWLGTDKTNSGSNLSISIGEPYPEIVITAFTLHDDHRLDTAVLLTFLLRGKHRLKQHVVSLDETSSMSVIFICNKALHKERFAESIIRAE